MKSSLRQKAIELRIKENLSYLEIKKRLGVSKSTLSYWLSDFPLSKNRILELRRAGWSKGEASRERFRSTMRDKKDLADKNAYDFEKKNFSHISKDALYIAGLMLYLAEGAKKKESSIVLANTDVKVIKFFIRWLGIFLDIPKENVRIQLHLYENMDIKNEQEFWRKELNLKKEQFYKSSVRLLKPSSFSYSGGNRHGTCSLYAFGVEKRRKIMMAIKAFMDSCLV